jgi:hypothetical protein
MDIVGKIEEISNIEDVLKKDKTSFKRAYIVIKTNEGDFDTNICFECYGNSLLFVQRCIDVGIKNMIGTYVHVYFYAKSEKSYTNANRWYTKLIAKAIYEKKN